MYIMETVKAEVIFISFGAITQIDLHSLRRILSLMLSALLYLTSEAHRLIVNLNFASQFLRVKSAI